MSSGNFRNKSLQICFTAVMWIFVAFSGNAQLVELNLSIKQNTIQIGERTTLQLEIIKHQKVTLLPFPLIDSLNSEIEILDSLKNFSADSLKLDLLITSFTAGQYKVPPLPLVFTFENNTDTIYSSELFLTVLSPEINAQADIRDVKPPLNLSFRLREIIPQTGLAIGILLILLILIFYVLRRLRKKIILEKAERALPPHIIAFRALDKLKDEKLWQKGNIKEYYSRLADILRVYLEKRFDIPAMEYVSSETIQSFHKVLLQEENLKVMLEVILQTSDIVKFAKADPLPAENLENMDNAYLFIRQTKIEELILEGEKPVEMDNLIVNENKSKE